jgi:hypothetical protein
MDIYEKYTQEELEEMFDEMLDECYPVFKIGSSEFYASQILANCDPLCYEISVKEYADSLQEQEDEE